MSLAELRKKNKEALASFQKTMNEEKSGGSNSSDERFWKPFFDKEKGRGHAIVRFLPAPQGEDLPWVKIFRHAFQGPTGKWFIENSLTTLGGKNSDCVGDLNKRLWNSGVESDKDVARAQKRKIEYITNVLVVDDPENPENNGKVFLYRFGPKIYSMLEEAMNPDEADPDLDPINPFDPWEGADFVIKMKGQQLGTVLVPNYDKSYFKNPKAMFEDDEEIESTWMKCHSLQDFVAADKFKTNEELKRRLFEVLGATVGSGVPVIEGWDEPAPEQPKQKPPVDDGKDDIPFDLDDDEDEKQEEKTPAPVPESSDDDDDMDFFMKLAEGDE